ncbi:interleukin-23 subunit alpha isoform X1 [Aotus nancymaae]|uniref:interleukin-23 subunit alpha isoform X1 n=1 Tax=Aotus nancymaae TaxID=37293 RepID=UPI0030FEDB22
MLWSRAVMLLLLLPWMAQGRAVPGGSSPAWAQCQQLSQKLCMLAWSAHPLVGHMVSGSLWIQTGISPSCSRLWWKTVALGGSWRVEGHQGVREDKRVRFLRVMGLRVQVGFKNTCLTSSFFPPLPPFQHLREEGDEETTNDVPHIQCGDGCDPQGLRDNSQFCLQRIHQGLIFYEKLLGSDIFTGEPSLLPDSPVGQLHASLLGLSQLLQPEGHHWETQQIPGPSPSQPWQRLLLRFKILRSLQAFVAVAARVFAHGAATLSP